MFPIFIPAGGGAHDLTFKQWVIVGLVVKTLTGGLLGIMEWNYDDDAFSKRWHYISPEYEVGRFIGAYLINEEEWYYCRAWNKCPPPRVIQF